MKKTTITYQEYKEILQKLEQINYQKKELQNKKKEYLYQSFHSNKYTLSHLTLSLNRENHQITSKINLEKKKFLSLFLPNKILYEKIKLALDSFIFQLIYSSQVTDLIQIQQAVELAFLNQLPTFPEFLSNIKQLVQQQEQNLHLIHEINTLLQEQEQLLIKKRTFEKNHFR